MHIYMRNDGINWFNRNVQILVYFLILFLTQNRTNSYQLELSDVWHLFISLSPSLSSSVSLSGIALVNRNLYVLFCVLVLRNTKINEYECQFNTHVGYLKMFYFTSSLYFTHTLLHPFDYMNKIIIIIQLYIHIEHEQWMEKQKLTKIICNK